MKAADIITIAFGTNDFILNTYLQDLSDEEILLAPTAGANSIAWQLGHLISSENSFVESMKPGTSPKLPEGFPARHSKEGAIESSTAGYLTKDQYLSLRQAQRAATLGYLATLSEEDLDKPGPEAMRSWIPTIGAGFTLFAGHGLLHAGQIAVLRRKLGKDIRI